MFSESHCHLRGITLEGIKKVEKEGFSLLLTSGIDLNSSIKASEIAKQYSIVKGCIGVHPWYADEYSKDVEQRFRNLDSIYELDIDTVKKDIESLKANSKL